MPAGFLVLVTLIGGRGLEQRAVAQFPIRQMPQRPAEPRGPLPFGRVEGGQAAAPPPATTSPPLPAVARITVPEKDGISFGSGTLIDARGQFGLIVSNWHVVRDAAGPITVEFPDGFKSAAQVIKTDKDWDLAALSIARPPVAPLPISPHAPQPGDALTIAGYGSGQWRMAAGRCTQYLAPGVEFPHEMVELTAEARQGDSGGPILNDRGELAGVLFGSGPGYTSGSYGGRVLNFLSAVVPGGAPGTDGRTPPLHGSRMAHSDSPARSPLLPEQTPISQPPLPTALHQNDQPAAPLNAPYGEPETTTTPDTLVMTPALKPVADPLLSPPPRHEMADRFGADPHPARVDPRVAVTPARPPLSPAPLASASALAIEPELPLSTQLTPRVAPRSAPTADLQEMEPKQLLAAVWRQFGGETVYDQTKSILAMIGVLALVVVFLRFGGQKEEEPHED